VYGIDIIFSYIIFIHIRASGIDVRHCSFLMCMYTHTPLLESYTLTKNNGVQ